MVAFASSFSAAGGHPDVGCLCFDKVSMSLLRIFHLLMYQGRRRASYVVGSRPQFHFNSLEPPTSLEIKSEMCVGLMSVRLALRLDDDLC